MNFTLSKRIAVSFALVLVFLLLVGWVGFSNSRRQTDTAERVAHTHRVLAGLQELLTHMQDVETGVRGYVITGDAAYLDPFHAGIQNANRKTTELRAETADNPVQQRRLDVLDPLIARRIAHSTETARLRREQGIEAGHASVASGHGKAVMDEIRKVVADMEQEERTLLRQREEASRASVREARGIVTLATALAVLGAIVAGFILVRSVTGPVARLGEAAQRIGHGDLNYRAPPGAKDELGALAVAFNQMAEKLQRNHTELSDQNWSKTNLTVIVQMIQGRRELEGVARDLLSKVVPLVDAVGGVVYLNDTSHDRALLRPLAAYGEAAPPESFCEGQGLPGQCLRDRKRILLDTVPAEYLKVRSGLGAAKPATVLLLPVAFEEQVLAVLELASFGPFAPRHLAFLDQLADALGSAMAAILASVRTEALLRKAQELSHELQVQQEELETSNQSLAQKNQELRASEEELQQSGEELKSANEELEEKARLLEQQNREVERARLHLEAQAGELARTSRYKSEFLANMSHELRTPLNSLLILSRMLADNADGNLSSKQVEYARTVHHSGQDLLELINDILDLSKIESGTVTPESEPVPFDRLTALADQTFRHMAESKGVQFTIERGDSLPRSIQTDERRLNQILKNLLSNAFKFTDRGSVTLTVAPATDGWGEHPVLDRAGSVIAFAVRDTGIGIPRDKLEVIFEAFQQADGSTARKYGGTGLGLSISRGLARMLGGALRVHSEPGNGSTFTLYLPAVFVPTTTAHDAASTEIQGIRLNHPVATLGTRTEAWEMRHARAPQPALLAGSVRAPAAPGITSAPVDLDNQLIEDDRASIQRGDHTLLVIEDDLDFARVVLELAHERGFKVIVAPGAVDGLELARHYRPSAISLDLRLPDADGWVVLDRLKHDPATSHIPVHIVSATDEEQRGLRQGAISYLQKPVSKESLQQSLDKMQQFVRTGVRQLLLVEDDTRLRATLLSLIGNGDVVTTVASSGEEALEQLGKKHFDCMVLDLSLPGMSGFQVLEKLRADPALTNVPVVVYTGRDLSDEEQAELERLSEAVILKGTRSPERLLDETALFLHRVQSKLPDAQRKMIERIRASDPLLAGKQLLVVDDDMRNIFTLTALLERHKMVVQYVQSGEAAIDLLEETPGVDVVLMDIMMPEMDGYETMRRIRANAQFAKLPVIALTAKAMKGDREKCLEAGASDYITKPVDIDQLLSLLRVWLYR